MVIRQPRDGDDRCGQRLEWQHQGEQQGHPSKWLRKFLMHELSMHGASVGTLVARYTRCTMNTSSSNLWLRVASSAALSLSCLSVAPLAQATEKKATTVRVNKTERLAPNAKGEYCAALVSGQVVRYRFESGAALDFSIHTQGGGVEGVESVEGAPKTAVQQTAVQAVEYVDFKTPQPARWCWTWINRGNTVAELNYTLFVAPPRRLRHR